MNPRRQRHGAGLCSSLGNGCVFLCVIIARQTVLKMRLQVCNKCGLFERAHAAPRPKAFPRRRRSRSPPAFGYPNTDVSAFNHLEYRHNDDRSYTGHFSSTVGATGGDTNSLGTTWMARPDIVSSTSNRLSPSHIVCPRPATYRAGSYLEFTAPLKQHTPSSHLSDYRLPM